MTRPGGCVPECRCAGAIWTPTATSTMWSTLRLPEEARIRALGTPALTGSPVGQPLASVFNKLPRDGQALVVEHRVRYLPSLEYRDVPAQIDVWVTYLEGAGLTLAYEIRDGVDGTDA